MARFYYRCLPLRRDTCSDSVAMTAVDRYCTIVINLLYCIIDIGRVTGLFYRRSFAIPKNYQKETTGIISVRKRRYKDLDSRPSQPTMSQVIISICYCLRPPSFLSSIPSSSETLPFPSWRAPLLVQYTLKISEGQS